MENPNFRPNRQRRRGQGGTSHSSNVHATTNGRATNGGSTTTGGATNRRRTHPASGPATTTPRRPAPPDPIPAARQRTFTREPDDDDDDIVTSSSSSQNPRRGISFQISLDDDLQPLLPPRTPTSLETVRPVNNYQHKRVYKCVETRLGAALFSRVTGIAIAPDTDNLYVVDSGQHWVTVLDKDGRFIKSFGSHGSGVGQLNEPFDATFYRELVVVSDTGNNRMQTFTRDGVHQPFHCTYRFTSPHGVTTDHENLIVCDTAVKRIVIVQPANVTRAFTCEQFQSPTYVAATRHNRILVSDAAAHKIFVFTREGDLLRTFGGDQGSAVGDLLSPRGVAVDFQGFVVVANGENHRVDVFRENGAFFCTFGERGADPGQFSHLSSLAITSNGRVVVGDGERVQVF